jgi:hypothetical protein
MDGFHGGEVHRAVEETCRTLFEVHPCQQPDRTSEADEQVDVAIRPAGTSRQGTENADLGHSILGGQLKEGGTPRADGLSNPHPLSPRPDQGRQRLGTIPSLGLAPRAESDGRLPKPPYVPAPVASEQTSPKLRHGEGNRAPRLKSYFESKPRKTLRLEVPRRVKAQPPARPDRGKSAKGGNRTPRKRLCRPSH